MDDDKVEGKQTTEDADVEATDAGDVEPQRSTVQQGAYLVDYEDGVEVGRRDDVTPMDEPKTEDAAE